MKNNEKVLKTMNFSAEEIKTLEIIGKYLSGDRKNIAGAVSFLVRTEGVKKAQELKKEMEKLEEIQI